MHPMTEKTLQQQRLAEAVQRLAAACRRLIEQAADFLRRVAAALAEHRARTETHIWATYEVPPHTLGAEDPYLRADYPRLTGRQPPHTPLPGRPGRL